MAVLQLIKECILSIVCVHLSVAHHRVQHQLCSSWALYLCNEVQWTIDCDIRRGWVLTEAETGIQVGASPQHNGSRIESVMAVCRAWVEPNVRGPVLSCQTFWRVQQAVRLCVCVCACMWCASLAGRLLGHCPETDPSKVSEQANKQAGVTNVCMCACVACVAVWKLGRPWNFPWTICSLLNDWSVGQYWSCHRCVCGCSLWVPTLMWKRRAKEEMLFGNYTEVPPVVTEYLMKW